MTGLQLRQDLDTLAALVDLTAKATGLHPGFVEKDFWVTELLRTVSVGDSVTGPDGQTRPVTVTFKGGTSLSKVYRIIDRFSEDVDILITFPSGAGEAARDKALKRIAERARAHLGLVPEAAIVKESTRGIKRNIRYAYPRRFANPAAREELLLEMGSRGGPEPSMQRSVTSLVADHATGQLGEPADLWPEFQAFQIEVLAPERTLLEKLSLLHDLATRYASGSRAEQQLAQAGRHYYDIKCLLDDPGVIASLTGLGPAGLDAITADIDGRSTDAGWTHTPRPIDGYAASPAFNTKDPCQSTARRGYETSLQMIHGPRPTYDQCLITIADRSDLI